MSEIWVCSRWNTDPKDEEKWEVLEYCSLSSDIEWRVKPKSRTDTSHYLPKSEYIPCEPPSEQWERVEVKLKWIAIPELKVKGAFIGEEGVSGNEVMAGEIRFYYDGYRVVSLVVERRKG